MFLAQNVLFQMFVIKVKVSGHSSGILILIALHHKQFKVVSTMFQEHLTQMHIEK